MSAFHYRKIHPENLKAIVAGTKRHEIRKEDRPTERNFQVGDYLMLEEWDPELKDYTGVRIETEITHVDRGWGLPKDMAVLSINLIPHPNLVSGKV